MRALPSSSRIKCQLLFCQRLDSAGIDCHRQLGNKKRHTLEKSNWEIWKDTLEKSNWDIWKDTLEKSEAIRKLEKTHCRKAIGKLEKTHWRKAIGKLGKRALTENSLPHKELTVNSLLVGNHLEFLKLLAFWSHSWSHNKEWITLFTMRWHTRHLMQQRNCVLNYVLRTLGLSVTARDILLCESQPPRYIQPTINHLKSNPTATVRIPLL